MGNGQGARLDSQFLVPNSQFLMSNSQFPIPISLIYFTRIGAKATPL
ncbi:MAG: hypothetical protein KME30_30890 [Iphinoe sp. HA4291-MV1]|nr:hypothetical protein [Iphinoe sp. HA4291-MV1]